MATQWPTTERVKEKKSGTRNIAVKLETHHVEPVPDLIEHPRIMRLTIGVMVSIDKTMRNTHPS